MDPDERVRDVIVLFLRSFERLGTASAVVRYFDAERQPFPRWDGWGSLEASVTWGALCLSRAVGVLRNPIYAGIYAYDRNASGEEDPEDPCSGGRILIPDSHAAYITVEQYERNVARLAANRDMHAGTRYNMTASGPNSTAMGYNTTASASYSTAMGYRTTASGGYSTAMGYFTTASGLYATAMGLFASTNGRGGSFVYGDASTSTVVNATANNSFVVRASGGTTFYSNAGMTAGVRLASGAGAWASISDRNRKQLFRTEDGESVLEKIAGMPIPSWTYKAQDASIRHLGPMSQDFSAAFGLGQDTLTITTSDISGVNMLAIQALEARTRDLDDVRAELRQRLAALEAALARLEAVTETNQR